MKNSKPKTTKQRPAASGQRLNTGHFCAGFTLVELMIVVSILGILAAIVIPEFQGHIQKARESAAKDTLRIFREAILRYAADHNGVPPGYNLNDTSQVATGSVLRFQLARKASNSYGELAEIGTAGYPYGPYLPQIPENPFNGFNGVTIIANGASFPNEPTGTGGWYYKPQTQEVQLNWPGTDSEGIVYYSY